MLVFAFCEDELSKSQLTLKLTPTKVRDGRMPVARTLQACAPRKNPPSRTLKGTNRRNSFAIALALSYKACVIDEQIHAEEHLRVIRSLMERATIYRAISAPTAFIGGLASLAVSGWLLSKSGFFGSTLDQEGALTSQDFIKPWLLALLLTAAANTFFIWRQERRERRPFLSPGLRLALRSLVPSFFVAAAITFVAWRNPTDLDGPTVLALSWISFYGLGLLATLSFAPRSLVLLGGSFVFTAVLWLLLLSSPALPDIAAMRGYVGASFAMGLTFGVFHLIYAACAWSAGRMAIGTTLTPE